MLWPKPNLELGSMTLLPPIDLEIEVVGLVDGRHQRFFRCHHVVGARFEVGEQCLDDLYTE